MSDAATRAEIEKIASEFGANPMDFFWLFRDSENPNLDYEQQNAAWAYVKSEPWHGLNLSEYRLWGISDNGHLLWWNGAQTVAMLPRDHEFSSVPLCPSQFIRLLSTRGPFHLFPNDLFVKVKADHDA